MTIEQFPTWLQHSLILPSHVAPLLMDDKDSTLRTTGLVPDCPPMVPDKLWTELVSKFNFLQLRAIEAAAVGSPTGITLIQGPPGTGKTSTCLGILSVFLAGSVPAAPSRQTSGSKRPHPKNESLKGADERASKIVAGSTAGTLVPASCSGGSLTNEASILMAHNFSTKISRSAKDLRILVCAPSNQAVDELVLRLCNTGLFGRDGARWDPIIVRIGMHMTMDAHVEFNLEAAAAAEAAKGGDIDEVGSPGSFTMSDVHARTSIELLVEQRFQSWAPGPSAALRTHCPGRSVTGSATSRTPGTRPTREQIRRELLRDAHIVAATLSGTGSQVPC
jgi:hypothetical protein